MAAKFKSCSVDGCNGNAHYASGGVKGYCRAHYRRLYRYGDPQSGGTYKNEPGKYLDEALKLPLSECMIWPFARDAAGYGQLNYRGKVVYVHRLVCERVYGAPPTANHQAAHTCGNGPIGCFNPHHVRWETPIENAMDRYQHGTMPLGESHPMAKLTAADVVKIRSLKGTMTQKRIGELFGVGEDCIGDIHRGVNWAWL